MKYVKLDRRHTGFGKWKFMIKFAKDRNGRNNRAATAAAFRHLYGPDIAFNDTHDPFESCFVKSDHWRNDATRNRIYFNDETVITFLLLTMEHNK